MRAAAAGIHPVTRRLPDAGWLVLGAALLVVSGMRYSVAPLAWVAPVPWLIYLRRTGGWRSRLALAAAMQVGALIQVACIVTDPVPLVFAPMFSVPMALGASALYITWDALRRRAGEGWGLVLFPSLAVLGEWLAASGSELGSWGAAAYTQLDNLSLLQTTSLLGLSGISWLMAAVAVVIAAGIDGERDRRWRRAAAAAALLVAAAHLYGAVRLSRAERLPLVTVAAVVSDLGLDGGGLPPAQELAEAERALLERSALAMERGAELVAWNEGAVAVRPEDEAAFVERAQAVARAGGADLVIAYVVPLDGMRRFENKYLWLTPDGPVQTYHKLHPVPGEGSVAGDAPAAVLERPYGRVSGAICYDYDFPSVGRAHAEGGAGLVVVPSSDWRGIDPYHTRMAAVRGIEGGFSVLRPVRWATSGAYDAYGRARATMSWFEDGERTMLARVPATRVSTLYGRIGDVLPLLSAALVLAGVAAAARGRIRGSAE